ncbi:MAG: nucleotidyltransferase [Clostridia bacterium]|nr:nucleotidyltransferase [Clostridia bacterium]
MKKPVLVIMAAGMGSRYGGLKQMDPIGPSGELIIDYSIYDAKRAGFEKVVCIIKHEIEEDFKAIMNKGAAKHMDIQYAFQDIKNIPEGFSIPEGRVKPWGTGHAILSAKDLIDGPFVVINADDYYGPEVFKAHYDYLMQENNSDVYEFCMGGYKIENTLLPKGSVSRGVCITKDGYLSHIDERKTIQLNGDDIQFTLDDGESWTTIPRGTNVSMNFFGFTKPILKELEDRFPAALENILNTDPIKGEFFIPIVTSDLVNEGKARVKILPTSDKWYGVTNKEDRDMMVAAMQKKTDDGEYPQKLWL